jgi:hypothetical protein
VFELSLFDSLLHKHYTSDMYDYYMHKGEKVKLSLYLIMSLAPRHEDVWGSGGIAPPFLTLVRDGGEWSTSRPCCSTLGHKAPGTYLTGGWVGLRASLDAMGKRKISYICRESNPGCPVCTQFLYRLSYPAHLIMYVRCTILPMLSITS